MLQRQFRMHPQIGRLVSELFYPEGLKHGFSEDDLPNDTGLYNDKHIAWLDTSESEHFETGKYQNEFEADIIIEEIKQLLKKNSQYTKEIGIITFYNEQLKLLNQKIKNSGLENSVICGTVDAFQGKECEIIFLSTVRSNTKKNVGQALGFLRSPNRLNVALSRARRLLVIVGNSSTLTKSDMFEQAFQYVKESGYIDQRH